MAWVAGVDGCKGGWIVVLVETAGSHHNRIELCKNFEDVLSLSPSVIAIDIPIGLLEKPQRGGRDCDRETRKLLGPRRSSVFSPPARNQFDSKAGMSKQTQGIILPKIVHVDRQMRPELQKTVFESHPELAFLTIVGAPMEFHKKKRNGREERLQALSLEFPSLTREYQKALEGLSRKEVPIKVGVDDLLDAYALATVALRIAKGKAMCLPVDPPIDNKGLRMEIWY